MRTTQADVRVFAQGSVDARKVSLVRLTDPSMDDPAKSDNLASSQTSKSTFWAPA